MQTMSMPELSEDRRKWFRCPVNHHKAKLGEIDQWIPKFERCPFGLPGGSESGRANPHLDMIVRLPVNGDDQRVPVGVVSKEYTLIQHRKVLKIARKALESAGIELSEVNAHLQITENGERMHLGLFLPKKYQFMPRDKHPMDLRLECINSVEGSTGFRALMGWFRLVCYNGMVLGVTQTDLHRRHVGDFRPGDIREVLQAGLTEVKDEINNFEIWQSTPVKQDQIADWVEASVRKTWGFKAAARAWHIACKGIDVSIAGPYVDNTPTSIPVISGQPVPGAPSRSENLFDVSQILSWLARERNDLQEQLEWREQIPALMTALHQQN